MALRTMEKLILITWYRVPGQIKIKIKSQIQIAAAKQTKRNEKIGIEAA